LGRLLEKEGIPHQMLNAKNHEQEAQIIAQAGREGAVTVATNMAGRGVDIVLGGNPQDEEQSRRVRELGGLAVIGTERHEARRIDNQLRGRSGRQGDPGSTQFFVSLEDDLMRIFGGEKIKGLMEKLHLADDQPIETKMISGALESAQSKIEGFHFDARKHLLEFDNVLNKHRDAMYRRRREVLKKAKANTLREQIINLVVERGHSKEEYEKKEQELGEEHMRQAERVASLRVIDSLWLDHLENMEHLRDSVKLRAYGQQDPLIEYKNEGRRAFEGLLENIDENTVQTILHMHMGGDQQQVPTQKQHIHASASSVSTSAPVRTSKPSEPKIGRNDPCPCGSGKKYKKCHGI
jgi:preprotein translocase subunit SecA